ncbi:MULTISPECIES: UDP-N-acetylmuramoyl-tripeptide--D-alanyl-D-alanine ligase [Hungatella]|uniref:UDP-N-acetylmuramoyl-tripeptide--D-alanyl-D- alanine ligase n=1 Tax=Hungatella TaxID=1649459 RepID=UPI0021087F9C|nr:MULTISPECIES: UDP-N-acetylmuramoyl-tripeptide--D-alanyl-D-alanine ligase [Hungatella]MCI6452458.1 UDP-N-acetylmuramoyl-tripeptide--D-alanyl-D-alanine ligase [Hungatella sp.]MCQ5383482.1 UDP-N-acetylmuramoyl-tripeptide--D-alanyl-D-alanine ligase [Hungatella hathewayi]
MEQITVKEILEATGGRLLCGSPDTPLDHVSIDSRTMKGNDLFVPLVGEKVDAHRFIGQAFDNGAAATFTSEHDVMEDNRPWIRVSDTKRALQALGAWYRRRLKLPLVGITGSVGKTTTREMVACALSARYRVYKTPANHNSQVGVPITMTEISGQDEIGVIELGMSEPGELTVIAGIAQIQMAVITNIGITHIEQLGSQENIFREKLSIQDGLTEHGILFLNGDDELLKKTTARDGFETIYYGTGENCHYRAVDVRLENGYPVFTAVCGDERVPVRLKVMGTHNVANAMVSLAVASVCGIPMEAAAKQLAEFTGFQNRQQIYHTGGMTIIDDTYNASPVSMKAGLEVLNSIEHSRRRVAVLADMKELGPDSPRYHYEIGTYIAAHPVDKVAVLGELAKEIARGVREQAPHILVYEFMDREPLVEWLKTELREGDAVLFKGSNSMELGKVAAVFLEK